MDIIDLKARFKKWLMMPEYSVVDVILGCIVANIIPGEATNLYVVGPSGTGKTEVIRAMEGYHKTQAISRMTSTTLVSGFAKAGRASLLTKLGKQGKTIILMKDFTSVLSMRPEVRTEILSQIREISDGKYDGFYGNDDSDSIRGLSWKGKLAFIAGVTNIIDEHQKVIQSLGERFLYYRMPKDNPMAVATFAQNNAGLEEDMRKELTNGVRDFMRDIILHPIEQSKEMQKRLISLACMVAGARSVVSKNPYTGVHNYEPQPEGPSRLIKQLSQLGSGIANVLAKDDIDDEVYDILKKVATDTLPGLRYKIILWMTSNGLTNGSMATTSQICNGINMSLNTTRHHLEDFESMEVVRKKVDGTSHSWSLTPMFVEYLKAARII